MSLLAQVAARSTAGGNQARIPLIARPYRTLSTDELAVRINREKNLAIRDALKRELAERERR